MPAWPDRGSARATSPSSVVYGPTSEVQPGCSICHQWSSSASSSKSQQGPRLGAQLHKRSRQRPTSERVQRVSLSPMLHSGKLHVSMSRIFKCMHGHRQGAVVAGRRSLHKLRQHLHSRQHMPPTRSQARLIAWGGDARILQRNHA